MRKKKLEVPLYIIVYELLLGIFEIIFSIGIGFFGQRLVILYEHTKNSELAQGSNDVLITFSEKLVPNLFHHRYYIAILLLGLGLVKFTSGIGLIYKKEWAKHLLIIFLITLIPFDAFAIIKHPSLFTLFNLLIDIIIIFSLIQFQPRKYFKHLKQYISKGNF